MVFRAQHGRGRDPSPVPLRLVKAPLRDTLSPRAERVPHFLLDTGGIALVSCRCGDLWSAVQPRYSGPVAAGPAPRARPVAQPTLAPGLPMVGLALAQRRMEGDELSGSVGQAGPGRGHPVAEGGKLSGSPPRAPAPPLAAPQEGGAILEGIAAARGRAGGRGGEPHRPDLERTAESLPSSGRRAFVRSPDPLCHPPPHGGVAGRAGLQCRRLAPAGAR